MFTRESTGGDAVSLPGLSRPFGSVRRAVSIASATLRSTYHWCGECTPIPIASIRPIPASISCSDAVAGHDHRPRPAGEQLQVQVHRALVDRADGVGVVEDHLARGLHVEPRLVGVPALQEVDRVVVGHAGEPVGLDVVVERRDHRAARRRRPRRAPGRASRKRRSPAGCRTAGRDRPRRAGSAPARARRRRPAAGAGRARPSPAARPRAPRRSRTPRRRPSSRAPGRCAPPPRRARPSRRRCG